MPLLQERHTLKNKRVLMLCNFWAVTTDFFSCEVKFSMEFARFCKKLLPTKAGLIALLNLLII